MLRRSPLKRKRDKPRRNEGRVSHGRIKEKCSRNPNVEERAFWNKVAGLGCLVCGSPATIHHVTSDGFKRITRQHNRVAPLCAVHHQKVFDPKANDPVSVEGLGHGGFKDRHGFDLLSWATEAWEHKDTPDNPFWVDSVTRCRELANSGRGG